LLIFVRIEKLNKWLAGVVVQQMEECQKVAKAMVHAEQGAVGIN
jgi:hypothetical protein